MDGEVLYIPRRKGENAFVFEEDEKMFFFSVIISEIRSALERLKMEIENFAKVIPISIANVTMTKGLSIFTLHPF